jgi:hypothetical protein
MSSCHGRIVLDQLMGKSFWTDLCASKDDCVFFYHQKHSATYQQAMKPGHEAHRGAFNPRMNEVIGSVCKDHPLSLFAYPKAFMNAKGATELADLKSKVIRGMAVTLIQ